MRMVTKMTDLNEQNSDRGRLLHRCLMCHKAGQYEWSIRDHMWTHLRETRKRLEALMREEEIRKAMERERLAVYKENEGVDDLGPWEEYYLTNCKLRRGMV